jgi:CxxC-x17-CxxC domain-containing protein
MTGQSNPCTQCGEPFVFTDAERAFFEAKGLLPPKRCKACRAARKTQSKPQARPSRPSSDRPLWPATCTGCGGQAAVPFEPRAGRDVFCGRCWSTRRDPPRAGLPENGADSLDPADTDAEREVGVPAIIE